MAENNIQETQDIIEKLKSELEETKKALAEAENQIKSLQKYQSDLIDQNKINDYRLNILCKVCSKSDQQVQTEQFLSKCEHCCEGGRPHNFESDRKITDQLREWATVALDPSDFADFVYDVNSNTYYSHSTGWYYYPGRKIYYDSNSKKYYEYNQSSKSFEIYSPTAQNTITKERNNETVKSESNIKVLKSETKSKHIEGLRSPDVVDVEKESEANSSEKEKTELIEYLSDSTEEGEIRDDETQENCEEKEEKLSEEAENFPCLRMIVESSHTLDIGSLLLVTCKGALVGKDVDNELQIPDESVSRKHAKMTYSKEASRYCIMDLDSKNGVYINGERIPVQEFVLLEHNDKLKLGECEVLVHFHKGKDVTCIKCEPGCVQASLKCEYPIYENTSPGKEMKAKMKQLRKKYGINQYETNIPSGIGYLNRAEKRRRTVGSDNPYEKTAEGTALDKPLVESNKGFKMLKIMGWKGTGLGKKEDGVIEPIPIQGNVSGIGLG